MARHCTLLLAFLSATTLLAQRSEIITVHFPLASASPHPRDEAVLQGLCGRSDIGRVSAITIKGHTDARGSVAYNEALSQRRTGTVWSILSDGCLAEVPVTLRWSGKDEPLSDQRSEHAHAGNRRVDVTLMFGADVADVFCPNSFPGVSPLLSAIDKPHERVLVDASVPIDLTMGDGTRVRIPAGAIVDAAGDPVNGPVELRYRGFHDPYEIIASGIPMHVNTPSGPEHMESAGMYEIEALLDGRPLGLAPGAGITLEPERAPAKDEGFITWRLDEGTGTWTPDGTMVFVAPDTSPGNGSITAATQAYWSELFRLENQARPDSTLFEERRRSARYCHLAQCDTNASGRSWIKRRNRFRDEPGVPEITVKAHKGIHDPANIVFSIGMHGNSIRQFPDWRRIPHNVLFRYTGTEPRGMFKQLYGRRHFFQDIHLDVAPGSVEGTLWLKENGEWLEMPVEVMYDRGDPLRERQWERAMTNYAKALAKRRMVFDRDVHKRVAKYERERRNMPLRAWQNARSAMDKNERTMGLDAWLPYAEERPYEMPAYAGAGPWAMFATERTSITIYGFGKVNVDRYLQMPEQVNVIAATFDPDGRPFPWVRAYAVPKGRNAVITYQGSGQGRGDAMLVAPGLMGSLFLVDADGRVMMADVSPLNSGGARAILHAAPVHGSTTLDDLRAQASR